MEFNKRWNEHLRREASKLKFKVRCPTCNHEIPQDGAKAVFAKHYSDSHPELLAENTTEEERAEFIQAQWEAAQPPADRPMATRKKAAPHPVAGSGDRVTKSPTPSIKREGSKSRSMSPPKRSKARAAALPAGEDNLADVPRGAYQGKLWTDGDALASRRPYDKSNVASNQRHRTSSGSAPKQHRSSHALPARGPAHPPAEDDDVTEIIKQPETRPISQEQLVAEVKGIYAGLVLVESKCIEVDNNQSSQTDPANKLNHDQWQALIALHRTLLHEHHDFFLASQHPSASPALRRLAAKYAMPARMWRHGIHSFLELLRHRLPESLDHMLTFIYMAYSMMALLYETVPAFEDTWIECLGDLGRYRMAIEDDDIRDREVWTAVSRHWYSKASDKAPTTGRLYHHLAILARPNALQQLYYYAKSLCVEMPFLSARESILTLLEPIMSRTGNPQQNRLSPSERNFVKLHAILFSGKQPEDWESTLEAFLQPLDNDIARSTRRWLEPGYHIAVANICSVTGYGDDSNPIAAALKAFSFSRTNSKDTTESQDQPMQDASASETPSSNTTPAKHAAPVKQLPNALRLLTGTYDIACRRFGDPNVLPFLHVTLVLVHHLTFCPDAMAYVAPHFPWKLTAFMLNTLLNGSAAASPSETSVSSQALASFLEGGRFPGSEVGKEDGGEVKKEEDDAVGVSGVGVRAGAGAGPSPGAGRRKRPLPDDFAMRGFPWVEKYFPDGWFVTEEKIDDDEKYFEVLSMQGERRERIVWLGCRIAEKEGGKWLQFDKEAMRFGVNPTYDVKLDLEIPGGMPATPGASVDCGELPDAGAVA
ncbi:hypothetical protein CHGG_06208 [Chaetomium globosum CBS 148.51]|uniref:DNA/RNA-binding domain-containing protein n=1 Tax=Chaetomium globosum (strain ATCC 6205 / CBS 148.51 / DSM 1962 / NBRC 6347 / NRRL 1970) TaxID=306901 RepID=Q2H557_CHAGB|nr:uncharacterized protein CHGG_06208 [Chaetomium globosum CBS 148.51]EAQ89589.1 hypothetical protein CHGG_06208 [Chaetomium globosum CBS 148.51]